MTPNQEQQKERARAEAEHHQRHSMVDGVKSGDFGYEVEHSALYRAGGKDPNKPLSRSDMNKAQKEIDEGK